MHVPVLLNEVIEFLNLSSDKSFIDATLDGGGHVKEILSRYPGIKILGIELDPDEVRDFRKNNPDTAEQMKVINDSYINIKAIGQKHNFRPDAILFDLGLSSWHYESSGRGFSFQKDEMLDMRFNPQTQKITAAEIINTYDVRELERILAVCGEEQFAKEIAQAIIQRRKEKAIANTQELVEVIKNAVPEWYKHKKINPATKTFQALRVIVNDELENIHQGVSDAIDILNPGGRIVVISFQGQEDKIIKEIFKNKANQGLLKWVTKDTIKPSWDETRKNPRARSAKMKIAERI